MISNVQSSFRLIRTQAQAIVSVRWYNIDTSMFGPPMKQKKDNDVVLIEPLKPVDINVNVKDKANPEPVLMDDTNFDLMNKIAD
jgi:hypothetical protein